MPDERRLVRSGERFRSDELDLIDLELPEPSPEPPEEEQAEPWGTSKRHLRRRLHDYENFLDGLGYDRERDRRGD